MLMAIERMAGLTGDVGCGWVLDPWQFGWRRSWETGIDREDRSEFQAAWPLLVCMLVAVDPALSVRLMGPARYGLRAVREDPEAALLEGFDPGSERTLAAWIRHASRGRKGLRP